MSRRQLKHTKLPKEATTIASLPMVGDTPAATNFEEWFDLAFHAASWVNNMITSIVFNTSDGVVTLTLNDTGGTTKTTVSLDGRYALTSSLSSYQLLSEKSANNGYASLDSGGKVPASELPTELMHFKGNWNATTNSPALANSDTNVEGFTYRCSVAGTVDFGAGNITFAIGDWVFNNGTIWDKGDNTDAVATVHGRTGTVVGVASDYDADQIDFTTYLTITSSDVQAAIQELKDELDALSASDISNTPSGNLIATDVQAALNELQTELDSVSGGSGGSWTGVSYETDWEDGEHNEGLRYRKITLGSVEMVHLQGCCEKSTVPTSTGELMATIPVGFRPITEVRIVAATFLNIGPLYVKIGSNGNLEFSQSQSSHTSIGALDEIFINTIFPLD